MLEADGDNTITTFQPALVVERCSENVYFVNEQILPGQGAYFFNRSELA